MRELPLLLDGAARGKVRLFDIGSRVRVEASCPFEDGYIYRVVLRGSGASLPLGVMTPQNDAFVLRRELHAARLPAGELRAEIDRRLPGQAEPETRLPFAFSDLRPLKEEEPSLDPFIADLFRRAHGMVADCGGTAYLVHPWEIGEALETSPLFCFLSFFRHGGRGWCALGVSKSGELFAPLKADQTFFAPTGGYTD